MKETALHPWVIAEKNGKVLAGPCYCMAGLGESCTHVAALLFAIEAAVRIREIKSVTAEKAYWMLPSSLDKVKYSPVSEIDFDSPQSKKQCLDKQIKVDGKVPVKHTNRQIAAVPAPSENEITNFYSMISQSNTKPAVLSLVAPFSDRYIPACFSEKFPKLMTEYYNEDAWRLPTFDELMQYCKTLQFNISQEQIDNVEEATREQANSEAWYNFKAGRISSSTMKACCRTNPKKPSVSLIKRICYPSENKFVTEATAWGCQHEAVAIEAYKQIMNNKHTNFKVVKCGFVISKEYPFMGASPDSIVSCDCCGMGCAEVKCPFCIRHKEIEAGLNLKYFCLVYKDDTYTLSKEHSYFYQLQSQLHIVRPSLYGDFILWTEKEIFIERILPDMDFWQETVGKAKNFFYQCLLPELVAKYFTTSK